MEENSRSQKHEKAVRMASIICIFLFSLYFVNVFVGKAATVYGWKIFQLGNVGEFLLLVAASIFLVVVALYREAMANDKNQRNSNKEV